MIERRRVEVEGLVQGVGFRPFVYELATRLALRGEVRNDAAGVSIDVAGETAALEDFIRTLRAAPPPLASVEAVRSVATAEAATDAGDGFRIAPSRAGDPAHHARASVMPDMATCDDCRRELFDPADRRYRYPFLTCVNCGPRLTLTLGVPFDRARTTMRAFPMCEACHREYQMPGGRRFHAQTTACAECGPTLAWCPMPAAEGERLTGEAALAAAVTVLTGGGIVALKGLGGYHLACDATQEETVRRLRARKRREAKPLAVMVATLDDARHLAAVSPAEARLLAARERPIVLLDKRDRHTIAPSVAPGASTIGLMLPYTPLHHLLLADVGGPLVMTSGNASDEPIAYRDDDAVRRLGAIADGLLTHDREIASRCDDSVLRVSAGAPAYLRRSRGYAPRPVMLARRLAVPALGVGGHLKNTFCLARDDHAYVSHHVGDLDHPDALRALEDEIERYMALLRITPAVIVRDRHDDYASTPVAERVAERVGGARVMSVQHHHAHVASCLAEHGVTGPALGVAFDGAGLGTDGAIWGGEFLLVDGDRCERVAHLGYVPLPGGDAAARHPWRMAMAHLRSAYGTSLPGVATSYKEQHDPRALALVAQMLERGTNSPPTSSVGRLFDAVASLIGVRHSAQFEGQAAMELEALAGAAFGGTYRVDVQEAGDGWTIDPGGFIRGVMRDLERGRSAAGIAAAFHDTLAAVTADVATRVARRTGVSRVALSGGVFQNRRLLQDTARALTHEGLEALVHRTVPCNDGGLSLGQVWLCA